MGTTMTTTESTTAIEGSTQAISVERRRGPWYPVTAGLKRWIGELSGELAPELSAPEPAEPMGVTKGLKNGQSCVLSQLVIGL